MLYYSYRRASTGLSLAALQAGYAPKTTPTPVAKATPTRIASKDRTLGTSTMELRRALVKMLRTTPRIPPRMLRQMDSNRN